MKKYRLIPGLLLICIGLAAAAIATGLEPVSIALALCGFFCHRFHELITIETGGQSSTYITSGTGIPALTVMAILYSIGSGLLPVMTGGFCGAYVSMLIIQSMKGQRKGLKAMVGWGMNISLILTALYAFQYHSLPGIQNIDSLFQGFLRNIHRPDVLAPVFVLTLAGPAIYLLWGADIRLHSHGMEFYRIAGGHFRAASIMIRIPGALLLTVALSCTGLLYLSLKPLAAITSHVKNEPEGTAFSMTIFMFLLFIAHITQPWIAVIVSLTGAVALHLFSWRYDR